MSYSDENISAKAADTEYSSRARRRVQEFDAQHEETGMRRRRNSTGVPLPPVKEKQSEAEQQSYEEEDTAPVRRRSKSVPVVQKNNDNQDNDDIAPRRRRNTDYETDDRVRNRRESRNDEEYNDGYEDEPEYQRKRPHNRFMSWLESLRIVEEVPEDEAQDEYEDRPHREHNMPRNTRTRARHIEEEEDQPKPRASVPVPSGKQRRAEIAEYTEDDDYGAPEEETDIVRRRTRGTMQVQEPEYIDERVDAEETDMVDEDADAKDAAVDPEVDPEVEIQEQHSQDAGVADEAETVSEYTVESACQSTAESETQAAPAAADTDEEGDYVPVRRRSRSRANLDNNEKPTENKTLKSVKTPETQPEQTESLEQRYLNATIEEKRDILFTHWREQFNSNMVIPAKPEKLEAITSMVRQILNACSDEYALGERWEKIDELLSMYSTAVVAEYGYKKLLMTVQTEEKQRMYARPTEDKKPRSERPQTPKLDDVKASPDKTRTQYEEEPDDFDAPQPKIKRDFRSEYERRGYSTTDRAHRQYGKSDDREFDYSPARKGSISSLVDKVKSIGTRGDDNDYDEEGVAGKLTSRIKSLFRRGDVLDYSEDDVANNNEYDTPDTVAQNGTVEYDISDDKRNAGYKRSDDYVRPTFDSRNTEYRRPTDEPEADDTDYSSGYSRIDNNAVYDGYTRSEKSAPYANDYEYSYSRRNDAKYSYAADSTNDDDENENTYANDTAESSDEYYEEQDRSVYDVNDEDYSPDRPDYSRDYDDEDSDSRYSSSYSENRYDGYDSYDRGGSYR